MKRTIPSTLALPATLHFKAAEGKKKPRFTLVANSGEPMELSGFLDPVLLDLSGASFAKETTPVIADHDPAKRIGNTTKQEVRKTGIYAAGDVTSGSDTAQSFVADAKAGFPFEVSVGAKILDGYFVAEGETAKINGKEWTGPLIVAAKSLIRELSIVTLGADPNTSATVTAKENQLPLEVDTMPHKNLDIVAAEELRLDRIRETASEWESKVSRVKINGKEMSLAEAKAEVIRSPKMDYRNLEIACFHAHMEGTPTGTASGPFIHKHANGYTDDKTVLEAALASHAGLQSLDKHYTPQTLEAADRAGVTCLMDVAKVFAERSGRSFNPRSKDTILAAAFSTLDFSTLLSNVAGKSLENAYFAFPSVARIVARKLSPSNFKEHTGIRVTGDVIFKQLGDQGQLKHATLKDQSYTYSINTYGRMIGISRQSIIDDDLSGLDEMPRLFGRGAALAIEQAFWTLVLANTGSFFSTDNANLITGAGSALSSAGLASAVQKFLEQTDNQGQPINVVPRWLVTPPALKATADELYVSRTLNLGGTNSDDTRGAENVMFGKYEPLVSPYLGTTPGIAGSSDTAWYLFGNPNDVAGFGLAFLNGTDRPTIEQADQDFSVLGVSWRGYIDFGVCQIDHRGAVKSAGA